MLRLTTYVFLLSICILIAVGAGCQKRSATAEKKKTSSPTKKDSDDETSVDGKSTEVYTYEGSENSEEGSGKPTTGSPGLGSGLGSSSGGGYGSSGGAFGGTNTTPNSNNNGNFANNTPSGAATSSNTAARFRLINSEKTPASVQISWEDASDADTSSLATYKINFESSSDNHRILYKPDIMVEFKNTAGTNCVINATKIDANFTQNIQGRCGGV